MQAGAVGLRTCSSLLRVLRVDPQSLSVGTSGLAWVAGEELLHALKINVWFLTGGL